MTIVKELRIPLPMTVEEFQIGQLYAVAEASKEATTGQTAIEILVNESFDDPIMGKGQYTHKIYHIAGRCPRIIQAIAPISALKIDERAWNAYPYCKTVFSNEFLGDRFELMVESMHLPDDGSTENALNCDQKKLTKRKVQFVDIREHGEKEDATLDPSKIASEKASRGPLGPEWQKTADPLMCCYKLITIKFQIFGLQGKLESTIEGVQKDILTRFYKQVYCMMDKWYGLTLDDIRQIEEETKKELEGMIAGLNLATKEGSSGEEEQLKAVPVAKDQAEPIINQADTTPPAAVTKGHTFIRASVAMVLLKEFRIPMPVTVEEYHVGQLFTLMEASRENTDGDSGIEIIANEPYDNEYGKGQYTHKVIYMGSKMPRIVAALLPASAKQLVEKAWNSYPSCRTEYTNPFLGDRFQIIVQSIHLPDNGTTENAHNLTPEQLAMREVIHVDIGRDPVNAVMKPNTDPLVFKSEKTGRGPLTEGWTDREKPMMCCYKLITIKFQVFGFQTKVESLIQTNQVDLLTKFHKEIFCAIDRWYGLDMSDIRRLEDEVKEELARKMAMQEGFSEMSTPAESIKSTPF